MSQPKVFLSYSDETALFAGLVEEELASHGLTTEELEAASAVVVFIADEAPAAPDRDSQSVIPVFLSSAARRRSPAGATAIDAATLEPEDVADRIVAAVGA
jgi:hypothetical protein